MQKAKTIEKQPPSPGGGTGMVGRLLLALVIFGAVLAFLYLGFIFLRDTTAPQVVTAVFAMVWGVAGAWLIYWSANRVVEQLTDKWRNRFQPYIFVGPAAFLLLWYLALPAVRTFYLSLYDRDGVTFVGLQNYVAVFTDRQMQEAFLNNILWILFGTAFAVIFGLVVAVLADRSKYERTAKALIFMPLAISFVGAGVIWDFVYAYRPPQAPQIGLLNAIVVALGGDPQTWYANTEIIPWNNLFLIAIMVWLQTGFAMVIFSAAIKGISAEILEAGRVDGANEFTIFFQIIIPSIRGTIIAVTTTIVIFALKIFDIVWVMTGGQFGTEVIATNFYRQSFVARNSGYGSAIAIVLLICVIPVMIYNLKQFGPKEESF
jgi:alpha-glucoside transport system permease protein